MDIILEQSDYLMLCAPPADYKGPQIVSGLGGFPWFKEVEPAGISYEKFVWRKLGHHDEGDSSDDEDGGADVDGTGHHRHERTEEEVKMAMEEENYYEVLGLGELSVDATDDDLRRAYRKLLLKYHPDKSAEAADTDPRFLAIQKAYDVLSDPAKRREYDSKFDFDDSIPTGDETGDFYEIYGPVFRRNARFSKITPVPPLGDDDSSDEAVLKFYRFWTHFESWREFTEQDEHKIEEADSRDERRWMETQNAKKRSKLKKKEYERIIKLVNRARERDPRMIRMKEAEEAEKRKKKEAKMQARLQREQARKAREDEERKVREEKERKEHEEKQRIKEEKARKAREAKEAQTKLRNLCIELLTDDEARAKANVKASEMTSVSEDAEFLILRLSPAELNELSETMSKEGLLPLMKRSAEEHQKHKEEQQKLEEEKKAKQKAGPAKTKQQVQAVWTPEELSMLAKAVKKYPGGVKNRWRIIANFVNQLGQDEPKTKEDCIAKASAFGEQERKAIGGDAFAAFRRKTKAVEVVDKDLADQVKAGAFAGGGNGSPAANPEEWTREQQAQLENALRKFPASMDKKERWKSIAGEVDGKSLKQCIARFKELREIALKEAGKGKK